MDSNSRKIIHQALIGGVMFTAKAEPSRGPVLSAGRGSDERAGAPAEICLIGVEGLDGLAAPTLYRPSLSLVQRWSGGAPHGPPVWSVRNNADNSGFDLPTFTQSDAALLAREFGIEFDLNAQKRLNMTGYAFAESNARQSLLRRAVSEPGIVMDLGLEQWQMDSMRVGELAVWHAFRNGEFRFESNIKAFPNLSELDETEAAGFESHPAFEQGEELLM